MALQKLTARHNGSMGTPLLVFLVAITLVGVRSEAHDQPVHAAIAQSSVPSSAGVAEFLAANHLDGSSILTNGRFHKTPAGWVTNGAFHEDDFPRFDDHFYTVKPTRTPGQAAGLTDNSESLFINFSGITNSFAWATVPGLYGPASHNTNLFTWGCTRAYEIAALTNTFKADRDANMAQMFLSLGHVLHLNEDLSQPDHVRNDEHALGLHRFIENYGSEVYLAQAKLIGRFSTYFPQVPHGWPYWQSNGFSKLLDFWDRNLYTGSTFDLDADAGGGEKLGLAEWSNGNFLGEDTRYAEFYSPSSFHYFPHPSLADTDQPQLTAHTYTQVLDPITLANGKEGYRPYLKKTGAGVEVEHHSALHYIAVRHSPKIATPRMWAAVTINDTNVLQEYHANIIPKAIEYSAGILDYFFRGTLGVGVVGATNDQYELSITNTSAQDFSGGTFQLFYDDTSGFRTELTGDNFTNAYSGALAANASFSATFTPATNATNYILIYKGTIGTSSGTNADPVDATNAIAVTAFTGTNIFDALVWDNPPDALSRGSISAFSGGIVTFTTDGGVGYTTAGNSNKDSPLAYAGPELHCNVRVVASGVDDSGETYLTVLQDDRFIADGGASNGTNDIPFTISATSGSAITVQWDQDYFSGVATATLTFTSF